MALWLKTIAIGIAIFVVFVVFIMCVLCVAAGYGDLPEISEMYTRGDDTDA